MAYVNSTRTVSLADRLLALRADFTAALAKRKLFRTTLTELSALSDRELADLGIHRSMIKRIALEAASAN